MEAKTTSFDRVLDKEKCVDFFVRYGYFIDSENENTLVLKKLGTELTAEGKKFPKELKLLFKGQKTEVSLKYDGFVLFDTGDLQEELDLISFRIAKNIDKLVLN